MRNVFLLVMPVIVAACLSDPVLDRTLTAPDSDITGLAYGDGYLWAVDRTSKTIYKLDPLTGYVEASWLCTQAIGTKIPTGLAFLDGSVYVCAGTAAGTITYGYRYLSNGIWINSFQMGC